jgi:ATP-dependent Lhr-like helicase
VEDESLPPAQVVERREEQLESACRMLLQRYGVVVRDVLERETVIPRWREMIHIFRRLEARGEVRGGRFVSGFGGEQFALPEAVSSLREFTRNPLQVDEEVPVAAGDPMNLAGILVQGERVASVPGRKVIFRNGIVGLSESDQNEGIHLMPVGPGQLPLSESENGNVISF